jgi:hypothetical protein
MSHELRYAKCEICGDIWESIHENIPPRNDTYILSFVKSSISKEEQVALALTGKFRLITCEACAVWKTNDGN